MILVVNLNASLDKRYELADLEKGAVTRARSVENTPGGKGLHVANVATLLGEDCVATGFLGGKTGEFIRAQLDQRQIRHDFITIAGETRSCLAILTDDGAQTEILEPGPAVTPDEWADFLQKYETLLLKADNVVLSGSVPQALSTDVYARLISAAKARGRKAFLDTSGALLEAGIEAKPHFIKPNRDEIEALTGRKLRTPADAVREVRAFLDRGIAIAAISLGAEGSIVGCKESVYRVTPPRVHAVNPVGSGDAYVAGMAIADARGFGVEEAIAFAAACGTANAMERESGSVRGATVEEILSNTRVEKL